MATATTTGVYTIEATNGFLGTVTYRVRKPDGSWLRSPRFSDVRYFSTRAGARKAIHRDRTGDLS